MPDDESHIELISRLSVPRYATRPNPTPIPMAHWDDDPLYCLKVNDEWISHILGVMIALDQPDAWIGTHDEIYAARQQVNEIMVAFMEQCDPMSNCCPDPLIRVNPDGTISVSYDGGMTYTPATTEDPRKTAPQLPPIDDGDGADKKCKAANRVVRQMKDLQTAWADSLGTGLGIVQLALAFAAAVVVVFLSLTGLAAVLAPALLGLAASVVGTGTTAYNDLFTTDVWNTLLCKIYCNCGTDGQFTQSQFLKIRTQLDAAGFDPTVALAFSAALNAWQVDGLNNAAKIPTSDNLDCSDCDCPMGCQLSNWSVYPSDAGYFGTINSVDEETGVISVTSGNVNTDGAYYILIQTDNDDHCCQILGFNNDVHPTGQAFTDCGTPRATAMTDHVTTCVNTILYSSPAPFGIELILATCP